MKYIKLKTAVLSYELHHEKALLIRCAETAQVICAIDCAKAKPDFLMMQYTNKLKMV